MESFDFFLTTNPGLEKALKEEIKMYFPSWRPAFSAPGFLTYKTDKPLHALPRPLLFARLYGPVISKLPIDEHLLEKVLSYNKRVRSWALRELAPVPLNLPNDHGHESGDYLDVIRLNETHVFLACHPQKNWDFMGDQVFSTPFTLPSEAPSRAYLKIKEANSFSRGPIQAKTKALEFGSSPGGATYFLLENGVDTIGVDTGDMAPVCLDYKGAARFRHFKRPMQTIDQKFLLSHGPFDYLVCDVNLRPKETLMHISRLMPYLGPHLKHFFWTVKLTDWDDMPLFFKKYWPLILKELRDFRPANIQCAFLPSNHREFLVYLSW